MFKRHLQLTIALAFAALLSLAPAAMAISGSAAQGQSGDVQYVAPETTPPPQEGVAPSTEEPGRGEETGGGGEPEESGVAPVVDRDTPPPAAPAPLTEAAAPAAGELPFTGYLAITVLLIGAMSLLAGVWLRRRTGATTA